MASLLRTGEGAGVSSSAGSRQAATHEAAHVVAALRFGWQVGFANITVTDRGKGASQLEPRLAEPLVLAVEDMIVSLVGDTAVRHYAVDDPESFGMTLREPTPAETVGSVVSPLGFASFGYVADSDLERAELRAERVSSSPAAAHALFGYALHEARSLVDDPGFHHDVEAVAGALIERGELTGQEVTELLERGAWHP
jgi:hypothetical protein